MSLMKTDGHILRDNEGQGAIADSSDIARRMAACWNALEDMSTEDIESVCLAAGTANEVLRGALRQRERMGEAIALLAAIDSEARAWAKEAGIDSSDDNASTTLLRIRAFLAKEVV